VAGRNQNRTASFIKKMQYDVDDDGQHDADEQEGDNGEIEREIILLDEYIPRQLAQEGDVLAENQQQPDRHDHTAEDEQHFTEPG